MLMQRTAQRDDALLVEWRPGDSTYSEEEMKVVVRRGCVVDIAKTIAAEEADGENIGVAKFGPEGAAALIEEMNDIVASGALREGGPLPACGIAAGDHLGGVHFRERFPGGGEFEFRFFDFPEAAEHFCQTQLRVGGIDA